MIIKKFVAPTMAEALAKVKSDLGDQAVILKTRMNRKAGGPGDSADKSVEVTAAIEKSAKSRFELPQTEKAPVAIKKRVLESESETELKRALPSELLNQLVEEVAALTIAVNRKQSLMPPSTFFGNLSGEMIEIGRQLVRANISEQLALELTTTLAQSENALSLSKSEIKLQLKRLLSDMIPSGEPIIQKTTGATVVMFVGPTGSGKTSAIARVAMLNKLERNGQMAIISADNFRADSSQQIKSFCRILSCPCAIVFSPEELTMAIKSQDQGLLLIDTPGVNPRDSHDMGELQALVRAAKPHEIHLVVTAATPAKDMFDMLKAFGDFGVDKILITKLDETASPGGVVTAAIKSNKKLSYVSRSREIPGQFAVATSETLAEAVLSEASAEEDKPIWQTEVVGIWQ
jgi:flagellar biosynthesis protein FlhF